MIVDPFVAPQEFRAGASHLDVYEDDNLKVVRAVVSHARGAGARVNFHWLVARAGAADVEHFIDPHELRMFDVASWPMLSRQQASRFTMNVLVATGFWWE